MENMQHQLEVKNHRMGLYDDFLVKDNHIKVLGGIDTAFKVKKK